MGPEMPGEAHDSRNKEAAADAAPAPHDSAVVDVGEPDRPSGGGRCACGEGAAVPLPRWRKQGISCARVSTPRTQAARKIYISFIGSEEEALVLVDCAFSLVARMRACKDHVSGLRAWVASECFNIVEDDQKTSSAHNKCPCSPHRVIFPHPVCTVPSLARHFISDVRSRRPARPTVEIDLLSDRMPAGGALAQARLLRIPPGGL